MKEEFINSIYFFVENLDENNEQETINYLFNNEDEIEEIVDDIISSVEEEYELEFDGDSIEFIAYFIDRLSVYAE